MMMFCETCYIFCVYLFRDNFFSGRLLTLLLASYILVWKETTQPEEFISAVSRLFFC